MKYIIILLLVINLSACGARETKRIKVDRTLCFCEKTCACPEAVDGKKAKELVNDGAILLDVRTKEEFRAFHIEGAVNHPVEMIESFKQDKTKAIVIYCRSGSRSAIAAKELLKMGYEKVYDLGAYTNWEE